MGVYAEYIESEPSAQDLAEIGGTTPYLIQVGLPYGICTYRCRFPVKVGDVVFVNFRGSWHKAMVDAIGSDYRGYLKDAYRVTKY